MDITENLDLDGLTQYATTALEKIDQRNILDQTFDNSFDHTAGDFSFGVSGEAGLQINVLNDPSDDDEETLWQQLQYDAVYGNQAVLNYQVYALLNANAGIETDYFGLGLEANQQITLSSFLIHDKTKELKNALVDDLTNFKTFVDKDHVLGLQNKEAVSLAIGGELNLEAKLSYSDAIVSSISSVSKLFNLADGLKIDINMGAEIGFKFSISDQFETFVQKRGEAYHVYVTKSVHKTTGMSLSAQVGVKLSDPEVAIDLVNSVLDSAEEGLSEEVETLRQKVEEGLNLNEEELGILHLAGDLMGVNLENYGTEELFEVIDEKRTWLMEKVTAILESKIELAVSYNYEKINNTDTLFEADFTADAIGNYHKYIVALKVDKLLEYSLEPNSGISNLVYEKVKDVSVKQTLSIGLSLGSVGLKQDIEKSFGLTTSTSNKLDGKTTEVTPEGNELQVAVDDNGIIFHSISNYYLSKAEKVQEGKNQFGYNLNFAASMDQYFENLDDALCKHFDYQISLNYSFKYKGKTKQHQLTNILDTAVCWNIIKPQKFKEKLAELSEVLVHPKIKGLSYELHANIAKPTLDAYLDDIANLTDAELAVILAESVPYADVNGRETLKERRNYYQAFWKQYLQLPSSKVDPAMVEESLGTLFNQHNLTALADYESDMDGWSNFDQFTIANLVEFNFIGDYIKQYKNAFKTIHQGLELPFNKVINQRKFRKQLLNIPLRRPFNMRVLGRLLYYVAAKNNSIEDFESALEIKLPEPIDGVSSIVLSND